MKPDWKTIPNSHLPRFDEFEWAERWLAVRTTFIPMDRVAIHPHVGATVIRVNDDGSMDVHQDRSGIVMRLYPYQVEKIL